MENQKFYSVEKIAAILDVSVRTVRRLISDGDLKAIKVRKSVRVSFVIMAEWELTQNT